jgi:hypothetical protein
LNEGGLLLDAFFRMAFRVCLLCSVARVSVLLSVFFSSHS